MMKNTLSVQPIALLFRNLSQPDRVRILLTIGAGEACVCHLEAYLGLRQAYLSQHLMALRKAHILKSRREGRYIFYRLADSKLLDLIRMAGHMMGVALTDLEPSMPSAAAFNCPCPHCSDSADDDAGCCANEQTDDRLIEVH